METTLPAQPRLPLPRQPRALAKHALERLLFGLARRWPSFAHKVSFSVPWHLEGAWLRVPLQAGVGWQNLRVGPKDIALYRVIRQILGRTPGHIIDVGCNIGHFMELCLLVERDRPYVGFDVSLSCCQYLERFIAENGLPVHRVLPVALSNRIGVQEFLTNSPFDVCASLAPEAHAEGRYSRRGSVLTDTGDNLLERLAVAEIAFIKIDVEGLELEVLEGLRRTVAEQRPYLIFEVLIYAQLEAEGAPGWQRVAAHRRETALELQRFCREHDYIVYKMQQNGDLEFRPELDPGDSLDNIAMDHLALPREKAAQLLEGYPYRIDVSPQQAAAA